MVIWFMLIKRKPASFKAGFYWRGDKGLGHRNKRVTTIITHENITNIDILLSFTVKYLQRIIKRRDRKNEIQKQ